MHMRGEPATMQQEPHYDDAPAEIAAYLQTRVTACRAAGIADDRIAIDPGIGFGKTVEHNLQLLANLQRFGALEQRLLPHHHCPHARQFTFGKRREAPEQLVGDDAVEHAVAEKLEPLVVLGALRAVSERGSQQLRIVEAMS